MNPLPPSGIAELVGLETREVLPFLTSIQSLLVLDEDPTKPVKPFHKSFPDFITDPSRCSDTRFYVSTDHLHFQLVMNCLGVMNDRLEQNLLSLPDYFLNSEVDDLETRVSDHVGAALRYACQSWHNHLTETTGDVTGAVSRLRIFLEKKFLVWLEVISVLGATRGAITALEKLMSWLQEVRFGPSTTLFNTNACINKVARDEDLLATTRDCLHFVTTFFEPISASAVHIYHSALELSPLTSIVRQLYHHRRHTPFPKVVTGTQESWTQCLNVCDNSDYPFNLLTLIPLTWSPCGHLVATSHRGVEIRDPRSSELLSTLRLTEPTSWPVGLAYSPDGHSLAALSDTSLIIWDIQTGGVAKEIESGSVSNALLVWSLDGQAIGVLTSVVNHPWHMCTVHVYDVYLGTTRFSSTFRTISMPHIWAHNESFRTMMTGWDGETHTIDISEVGSVLTKIETFRSKSWGEHDRIVSLSPTTYRISVEAHAEFRVLDIRNSKCLLREGLEITIPGPHCDCFSSDGSLFAAPLLKGIHIWKYVSGRYTPWRHFPTHSPSVLRFSPTSSFIIGTFYGNLKVWRLDDLPIVDNSDRTTIAVLSHHGAYMATARYYGCAVTITSYLSQIPPQFIDTGTEVGALVLTDNVLLVLCPETTTIAAWRLTEEGVVDGPLGGRRADRGDSIWTIPLHNGQIFSIEDQTVVVEWGGNSVHIYHAGTGRVLKPAQAHTHPRSRQYSFHDMMLGQHYPLYHQLQIHNTRHDWLFFHRLPYYPVPFQQKINSL